MDSPYLSIVTCSRNDDHGEGMLKRMHITLVSLLDQLEKYKVESEIILVDYNPPKGKLLLKDVLVCSKEAKYCSLRTIIVPASIHRRCLDADKVPFNGPLAFNVGLRRSRGQFVLLMPIDNLFSDELAEFLANKSLENDKFYRADRLDVSRAVMEIDSPQDRIAFCKENILWIHTRYGSFPVVRKKKRHLRSVNLNFVNSHRKSRRPLLHTNAPDIMLASREAWFSIRGYPEIATFGLHLDSLLCYMAYYNGLKEEVLSPKCCLFHIDHDSRWRNIQPILLEKILFYLFSDRLALKLRWLINGVLRKIKPGPGIIARNTMVKVNKLGANWVDIRPILSEMACSGHPKLFNTADWGLSEKSLDEYAISRAEWDKVVREKI